MPPPDHAIGTDRGLLRQLAPPAEPALRLRQAVVQAVARPFVTVRPDGSDDPADDVAGVAYYESVGPLRIGDTVEVLAHGADWRVLGVVARAGGAPGLIRREAVSGNTTYVTAGWEPFYAAVTDMPVPAQAGDVIEVYCTILIGCGTNPPYFVPRFNTTGAQFRPYSVRPPPSSLGAMVGVWADAVPAAAIVNGIATVGVLWNNPTTNTIYANTTQPARFWAKNIGPGA